MGKGWVGRARELCRPPTEGLGVILMPWGVRSPPFRLLKFTGYSLQGSRWWTEMGVVVRAQGLAGGGSRRRAEEGGQGPE